MNTSTFILRTVAALLGVGLIAWAIHLYTLGAGRTALVILSVEGLAIIAGVIFERQRYRPQVDAAHGDWQKTGEVFKDPLTGKLMGVEFNPKTGERNYVEINSQNR